MSWPTRTFSRSKQGNKVGAGFVGFLKEDTAIIQKQINAQPADDSELQKHDSQLSQREMIFYTRHWEVEHVWAEMFITANMKDNTKRMRERGQFSERRNT